MGIPLTALRIIKETLPAKRVLMLGYQDLLISLDELKHEFPLTDWSDPVFNAASQQWHSLPYKPVDSAWALSRLGVQNLEVIDKFPWREDEIAADLNEPCDLGQHDLVIDAGTIEHCMNIGTALMNCANACAVGGYVFHGPPLNMMNHGFYNICPTLFYDFYVRNGWRIAAMIGANANGFIQVPRTQRFALDPQAGEMALNCLVQRISEARPVWQTQTKYQKMQTKAAA